MANTKISALTALTGASLATDDAFAVVDTSVTTTKKITVAELKLGIMPAPGPIGATTPSTGAFTTLSATTGAAVGGATAGAGGLAFPATAVAVANANTLDDYEEGTFTPVIAFGGASVGVAYSEQIGRYTKVGNKVSITIAITLAGKGSSAGALSTTGLPFTNATVNTAAGVKMSNTTFTGQYSSYVGASGTIIYLQHTTEAGTLANLADTNCTNISVFNFATSYLI